MKPRVIYSAAGTLTDFTVEANDYYARTAAIPVAVTTGFIYIGSYFPFNHFYYKKSIVNAVSSVMSIHYFDNTRTWRAVVEKTDETAVAGATLAQNGFVSFVPNKNYTWTKSDTVDSSGTEIVTGLGNATIYDLYWLRVSVSATLTAGTKLEWLGNLFSNDEDLASEYPDLVSSASLTAFESGKTSWEEQHVRAAELVIKDLKRMKVINSSSQILDKEDFRLAAVSKVAEIAYTAFGSGFDSQRKEANDEYKLRLNGFTATIDTNENALKELDEVKTKSVIMVR